MDRCKDDDDGRQITSGEHTTNKNLEERFRLVVTRGDDDEETEAS